MDKKAIKNFATWARTELIDRVKLRAKKFGVFDDRPDSSLDSYNGYIFTNVEKKQRQTLVKKIARDGFERTVEEVAYTWFNRFCALRFMEVNEYLPSRVRVFTNEANEFKPQIIDEVQIVDLEGLDLGTVFAFQDKNDDEGLFKYLIITQCNALNAVLPRMFQRVAHYTELLFPDNLRREESVVGRMIEMIPLEDWQDQVQIIGWLYQYYNSEKKDEIFKALSKNVKIAKEDIPAATQLFTPDWIVRYMVENSLGRLWIEGHPNDELKKNWKYYLEEAKQTPEVEAELKEIRQGYAKLNPEDIKCLDPCCGSGHILVYMFDVLIQIYASKGYSERDAARLIVEKNIFGLDIDRRAGQMAYFAIMMKGREYDARFLKRGIQPRVYAIVESNGLDVGARDLFCNGDRNLTKAVDTISKELYDAKEYGSIIDVSEQDWNALEDRFNEIDQNNQYTEELEQLHRIINVAKILAGKYEVVCTNPPYMGSSGMNAKLAEFVKKNYAVSKSDLFAVFIEKCGRLAKSNCFQAMVTQHAWMFLNSYEKLRTAILDKDIVNMAHLGARAFDEIGGEVVQTTSFVLRQSKTSSNGVFCRLIEPNTEKGKEELFLSGNNHYETSQENFSKIPGAPIAYWVSENFFNVYEHKSIGDYANVITGMTIGDNQKYLRLWQEVDYKRISFEKNMESIDLTKMYWIPYSKGGSRRNWYGNYDYIVNWSKKDYFNRSKTTLQHLYLKRALTWPFVTSGTFSARILPEGFLWDVAGSPCFFNDLYIERYTLGFLCSKVANYILNIVNPTINVQAIDLARIPLIIEESCIDIIFKTVNTNIEKSKSDWDSFETSWNFQSHPLVNQASKRLVEVYSAWESESSKRFVQLKSNEESLNKIFIDIYGLQNELTPEVDDKDVTVRKADKEREVKSLISYAVGCMFGRYSLDKPGLIYAGGEWDASQYKKFAADSNNVLPITEESHFKDDAASRFFDFIRTVYGAETLEENLKFIADALGGSGSPRDVIRNYFLNGFYADHVKIYQKRPIYWLFDSGKKNGFKCLIYMHRYAPDLLARIRTDYIHRLQQIYHSEISELDAQIEAASAPKTLRDLNKKRKTLLEQAEEVRKYEEKIHHKADQKIAIDLDDGVKVNYTKFSDVLATIK